MSSIEQTNELLRGVIGELESMPYGAAQELLVDNTDVSLAAEAIIEPVGRLGAINEELPKGWFAVIDMGSIGVRSLSKIVEIMGEGSAIPELRNAAAYLNHMMSAHHELGEMDNKMEQVLKEAFGSLILAGQALGQFDELRTQAKGLIDTSREDRDNALGEIKKITLDL